MEKVKQIAKTNDTVFFHLNDHAIVSLNSEYL